MSMIGKMLRLKMRRLAWQARRFDVDDALGFAGLRRRRDAIDLVLPMIGVVVAGAFVGATIAHLFAPSSGRKLRADMERKINGLRDRYLPEGGQGGDLGRAAGEVVGNAARAAGDVANNLRNEVERL